MSEIKIIYTNHRHYTPMQVVDELSQFVDPKNVEILVGHLCDPKLCEYITGFTENEGIIAFQISDGHMVEVKRKEMLLGR